MKNKLQPNSTSRILYQYIRYLKEAKGRKDGTIKKAEQALNKWFLEAKGYSTNKPLHSDMIIIFKEHLRKPKPDGSTLAPGTRADILLQIREFFQWLSIQPGYKSKINASVLSYFHPSPEESSYRKHHTSREYPTLHQVKIIVNSIELNSPLDARDQALIAFLLISGIRVDAAASLNIGSLNRRNMSIEQDPRMGARTKFSKFIKTYLINFDNELLQIFLNWHESLLNKGFGNKDPLFPKAQTKQEGLSFVPSTELSREFMSASQIRKIVKQHCYSANMAYFNPHSFRHACVSLAFERARDAQDIKAISINIGHESAVHVIDTYGQLPDKMISKIIHNLGENDGKDL